MTHTISSCKLVAKSRAGTRIYKRSETGTWTYKRQIDGTQRYFPLGYEQKGALELADKIRANLILHPYEDVLEMFHKRKFSLSEDPTPTIGDVEGILKREASALGVKKGTVKDYLDSLKRFARVLTGKKSVQSFNLGQINDRAFRTFKTKALHGITDQAVIASKKRTLNSHLRAIKAVFSEEKNIYDGYSLSFASSIRRQKFYGGLKKQYRLPPVDLIQKTFDLWPKTDGDVHTLLGLALIFGLRRNEIFHCRRSWFDFAGEKARVNIVAEKDFSPKGGHEGHTVGSKLIAKSILNKATGDDYLVKNRADSGRPAFEKALKELRAIGWERPSPLHELRKLFGSYIASTESIYTSQKLLRHADSSTTNESYADLIDDDTIKKLWAA